MIKQYQRNICLFNIILVAIFFIVYRYSTGLFQTSKIVIMIRILLVLSLLSGWYSSITSIFIYTCRLHLVSHLSKVVFICALKLHACTGADPGF